MGICGCQGRCECSVTPGTNVTVTGSGDSNNPYVVSAVDSPTFAAANVDGSIEIIPAGSLGHTPTLSVRIDPDGDAPVSVGPSGIKIDCCTTGEVGIGEDFQELRTFGATTQWYTPVWFPVSARLVTTADVVQSGLAAIDGVTPVAGDIILSVGQASADENGVFVAGAGAWTRPALASISGDLRAGTTIYVSEGDYNSKSYWKIVTTGTIIPGTTAHSWVPMDHETLFDTLPTDPVDGQVVAIQDAAMATAGVVWRFRYNAASASAYKWELIGGADYSDYVATAQSTSSTTYVDLATVGPSVTVPFDGEYIVTIGSTMDFTSITSNRRIFMSFAIGATAAVDSDAAVSTHLNLTNTDISVQRQITIDALAADAITAKYRVGDDTGQFANRYLSLIPVRVG